MQGEKWINTWYKTAKVKKYQKAFICLSCLINRFQRQKIISSIVNNEKRRIVLSHPGGGTQKYDEEHFSDNNGVIISHFSMFTYYMIWHDENGNRKTTIISEKDLFCLMNIHYGEIVISSLYGFPRLERMADFFSGLKERGKPTITYLIHDYHSVCPSIFLVVGDYFCGLKCKECKAYPIECIEEYRTIWQKIFIAVDKIVCFSNSSKQIILQVYPDVVGKVDVIPHRITPISVEGVCPRMTSLNIGIIGRVDHVVKGLRVLQDIIPQIDESISIYFIGNTKEEIGIEQNNVMYHGRYTLEKLPEIIQHEKINLILFPSVCPETFSYVLSEAMQFNLPIITFNIGAQEEKIRNYSKGIIVEDAAGMLLEINRMNLLYKQKSNTINSKMLDNRI